MSGCNLSEQRLLRWLDGDAKGADEIEAHVETCETCAARIDAWRGAGEELRAMVDAGVGDVEPLLAVQRIHERIAHAQESSLVYRARAWWQDLWTFNRRAFAGLAAATVLGVASAPVVIAMLGGPSGDDGREASPAIASVVVESLEFDGDSRAVVYRPSGDTTIIWVEPEDTHGVEEF